MDSKGDVERYKTCPIAKGFTQKEAMIIKRLLSDFIERLFSD